jgi:hypothetical protein
MAPVAPVMLVSTLLEAATPAMTVCKALTPQQPPATALRVVWEGPRSPTRQRCPLESQRQMCALVSQCLLVGFWNVSYAICHMAVVCMLHSNLEP